HPFLLFFLLAVSLELHAPYTAVPAIYPRPGAIVRCSFRRRCAIATRTYSEPDSQSQRPRS
ncbi:unnamed protein product, partial [Tilletia caries]